MVTKNDPELEEENDPRWYIVHTYSGQEDLVEKNLKLRIQSLDMQDRIMQVLVPTEKEVVFKEGKRKSEQRKLFPGYILVQMMMDDESWYAVRNTPGVTGFVSSEDEHDKRPKPVPLEDKQVEDILKQAEVNPARVLRSDWTWERRSGSPRAHSWTSSEPSATWTRAKAKYGF